MTKSHNENFSFDDLDFLVLSLGKLGIAQPKPNPRPTTDQLQKSFEDLVAKSTLQISYPQVDGAQSYVPLELVREQFTLLCEQIKELKRHNTGNHVPLSTYDSLVTQMHEWKQKYHCLKHRVETQASHVKQEAPVQKPVLAESLQDFYLGMSPGPTTITYSMVYMPGSQVNTQVNIQLDSTDPQPDKTLADIQERMLKWRNSFSFNAKRHLRD